MEVLSIHVISEPGQDFSLKVIPHFVNRFRNLSGPKHSGGIALRFARITRVRADKSPGEADTLGRVREIYAKQVKTH